MNGIVESVLGNAISSAGSSFVRHLRGWQIKISDPRPLEVLKDSEPLGLVRRFSVRGYLKRLPKHNEIWLITEDENQNPRTFWPQGFSPVQFDPHARTWVGKVAITGANRPIRIIAVVAPPTSQDFFQYYQAVGKARDWNFMPLVRVPAECTNMDSVQVLVP